MNLSIEVLVMIIVQVITGGVFIGGLSMAVKFIEKQLDRIEVKQDKYNNLIARTFACEKSLEAGHKRLDSLEEDVKIVQETLLKKGMK